MHLSEVDSSMVEIVGYDEKTQALEVVFASGKTYRYEGVPPAVYAELMAAESKGRYMRAHIIDRYESYPVHYRHGR